MSDSAPDARREREPDWKRKRRLEQVFGDVLPETTTDEREPGPTPDGEDPGERWLKEQVPPHHGD